MVWGKLPQTSFRDKLAGGQIPTEDDGVDEVVSDEDEDDCEEDDDPFCPTIKVTTEEKKGFRGLGDSP